MANFIDFAALKAAVSIDQVADWLQLDLNKKPNGQLRGCCPMHGGTNDREFVVTPSKGLFFCFGPCGGGDAITLTAQVLKIGTKEAAQRIAEHFKIGNTTSTSIVPSTSTVPVSTPIEQKNGATLRPLEYLSTDHPAIEALGLTVAVCQALGIGYAPKGMMRGRVVFPLRLPNGTLIGYQGLATKEDMTPLLLFPKNLDQMVAAPPTQEEAPKQQPDELRRMFRVVA